MNAAHDNQDIPDRVLDQAIAWAVTLGATEVDAASRRAFEQWLQAQAIHRIAWQRLQMVESEFAGVRKCPAAGQHALAERSQCSGQRSGFAIKTAGLMLLLVLLVVPLVPRQAVPVPVSDGCSNEGPIWSSLVLRGLAGFRPSTDGTCRSPPACRG